MVNCECTITSWVYKFVVFKGFGETPNWIPSESKFSIHMYDAVVKSMKCRIN